MQDLIQALSCIALIANGTASVMESAAAILRWRRRAKKDTPGSTPQ